MKKINNLGQEPTNLINKQRKRNKLIKKHTKAIEIEVKISSIPVG